MASARLFLKAAGGSAAENRSVSLSPRPRNINAGYGGGYGLPVSLQRANRLVFGTEMLPVPVREEALTIDV